MLDKMAWDPGIEGPSYQGDAQIRDDLVVHLGPWKILQ